jgi:hypothetical protein
VRYEVPVPVSVSCYKRRGSREQHADVLGPKLVSQQPPPPSILQILNSDTYQLLSPVPFSVPTPEPD